MNEHAENDRAIMRKAAKTLARMECMVDFYCRQGNVSRAEFDTWKGEWRGIFEGRRFEEIFEEAVAEIERNRLGIEEDPSAEDSADGLSPTQVFYPAEFDGPDDED